MDIRRLRYFAVVAELGSFTRASERLHIAQPALSRQVRQLEEELGLELFSRIGRHIKTTDAGQGLLRHVRTIERDFERLIEDMRSRRETPNGRVILGVPPALAGLVPMIISRVQCEFPQIAISIVEGISPVLSEWVQSNEVDLAILGLACEGQSQVFPGLKVEVLTTEDMVVIERASGSAVRRVYSLEALAAKPLVFSEKFLKILHSGLGPNLKLNIAVSIDSVQAIKAMVLHGSAATILPVSMFSGELREGEVIASALTSSGVRRQLLLAQPSFRQMTQATLKVAQVIKSEIDRLKNEGIFSADHFVSCRRKRQPVPARLVAGE